MAIHPLHHYLHTYIALKIIEKKDLILFDIIIYMFYIYISKGDKEASFILKNTKT